MPAFDQRHVGPDERDMYREVSKRICARLDLLEKRATAEHRAAALLIARFSIFRAKGLKVK